MANDPSLIPLSAHEIVDLLRIGAVTPLDLLDTLEARIAKVDPALNALPTLCFERAHMHARELMKRPPVERGHLAGMPIPIKDLTDVAAVRTTYGSPIFKDHVPMHSDVLVETIEDEGGIVYAKSNTPEFGAGANTFNEVFGVTRNPWNTSLSAAGSSGGAAAALASGMAWLAHGSDMGGSLRNPASIILILLREFKWRNTSQRRIKYQKNSNASTCGIHLGLCLSNLTQMQNIDGAAKTSSLNSAA